MANQSSFGIMVDTVLNTKKAEQQIKNFTKDREIITKIKVTNPTSGEVETALKKVTTLVDQYGKKVKETSVIDLNGKKISSDVVSISDSFKTLNTQTNKYKDEMGAVVTEIKKFDQFGNSATTKIKEYTDAQGYAVKETQQFNAVGEQVGETVKQMTRDLTKEESEVKKDTEAKKENSKATKEMSNSNKNLGQSFADIVAKVSKFYLATLPIQTMQRTISEAVETVKEFDKAITEMGKVSDYSGEKLKQYTRDLAEMGAETGRTLTEITDSTTGWLKAGYNEEDASRLAKYSALLQNTADEQLSGAEATEILVSQLKAYNMSADEAIKVTDILNAVSAQQAVSSGDIAKGLTQASASLATFGNDIYETTALLTAGTTIFQGKSSQVARGLNMIATRVAKAEGDLANYGVAIKDSNGNLRSTYDILMDLAPVWNQMSKAEQVALGNTLAGY